MQLNQATDYAFRAVLFLVNQPAGEIVTAQTIATQEAIPMRFLLKIMRALAQRGIVQSFRGAEGGYALARPPEKVTLLDVVEALEGPVRINRCLVDRELCNKNGAAQCVIHGALQQVQNKLIQELAGFSFDQLARKKGKRPDPEKGE